MYLTKTLAHFVKWTWQKQSVGLVFLNYLINLSLYNTPVYSIHVIMHILKSMYGEERQTFQQMIHILTKYNFNVYLHQASLR